MCHNCLQNWMKCFLTRCWNKLLPVVGVSWNRFTAWDIIVSAIVKTDAVVWNEPFNRHGNYVDAWRALMNWKTQKRNPASICVCSNEASLVVCAVFSHDVQNTPDISQHSSACLSSCGTASCPLLITFTRYFNTCHNHFIRLVLWQIAPKPPVYRQTSTQWRNFRENTDWVHHLRRFFSNVFCS